MKIRYSCSNCGKREQTSAMVGIPNGMYMLGYRAVGDAIYCPDCVETWAKRNGQSFEDQYGSTAASMFTKWWNNNVDRQAAIEHKEVKKYHTTPWGDYVEGGTK